MERIRKRRILAAKYKWFSIFLSLCTLLLAYFKDFFRVSERIVTYLNIGSGFLEIEEYLSSSAADVYHSLLEGKLSLFQAHKLLGILSAFSDSDTAKGFDDFLTLFYYLIIVFLGVQVLNIALGIFDISIGKISAVVTGIFIVFISYYTVSIDASAGESIVGYSMWGWACMILPFISVVLWKKYEKILNQIYLLREEEEISEDESESTAYGVLKTGLQGQVVQRLLVLCERNKGTVIFLCSTIVLHCVLTPLFVVNELELSWGQYEVLSFLLLCLIGITMGLAVIYAACGRYDYLILYALTGVIGEFIYYRSSLPYLTFRNKIAFFNGCIIALVLVFAGKKMKENPSKIFSLSAIAVLTSTVVHIFAWGDQGIEYIVSIDFWTTMISIVATTLFFVYFKGRFIKIMHIHDSKIIDYKGKEKKTPARIICPKCGERIKENAKYCSACGFSVENIKNRMQNKEKEESNHNI